MHFRLNQRWIHSYSLYTQARFRGAFSITIMSPNTWIMAYAYRTQLADIEDQQINLQL